MDKSEIKQGSFIQQTQYFIPVEIDLSVVPARLGIWFVHLFRRTTVIQDLLVRRQFSLVPDNRTNVNVEACTVYHFVLFHLAIALPALLRFMTSDNPFGIYKLFLSVDLYTHRYIYMLSRLSNLFIVIYMWKYIEDYNYLA